MKKLFLLLSSIMIMTAASFAVPMQVSFGVAIDDNTPIIPGNSRGPIEAPCVWIDEYQLDFLGAHPEYVLCLIDEDGEQVYETIVPSTLTSLILPSTLEGEYELQLIPTDSSYYFYGYVLF